MGCLPGSAGRGHDCRRGGRGGPSLVRSRAGRPVCARHRAADRVGRPGHADHGRWAGGTGPRPPPHRRAQSRRPPPARGAAGGGVRLGGWGARALAPRGGEVRLGGAAFRYSGGEPQVQAHQVGDVRPLPFPGPYAQVLTDLKPRVLDLRPDMPWLPADPARAEAIRASGARALLAVPLALRGAVFGLLSLYRTEQAGSFDETEVDLTLGLAAETALSIDRARLYTREHTIAATVQRRLLPARQCSQTGIEIAHAQVFGDAGGGGWCDSFTVAGARTALAVGQISGQGIQAAAAMGELRTVVRSLARLALEPHELLAPLHDTTILLAGERAALPPSDPCQRDPLTASCVYAIYDPLARTCTYARAHHPPPVIVSPDGTAAAVPDVPAGSLLGTSDSLPFTAATVQLPAGSVLAFYTPSILPAAPSGDPGCQGPLRRILAAAHRPLPDLCADVVYSLPDSPPPRDS